MDPSVRTQLNIRHNAEQLQTQLTDMRSWEEDMRREELKLTGTSPLTNQCLPPPRNVAKKRSPTINIKEKKEKKKISAYDYEAWDKFAQKTADNETDSESSDTERLELQQSGSDSEKQAPEVGTPGAPEPPQIDTQSNSTNNVDLAFFEKELGNKFVREGKWQEAAECYSRSIILDPRNSVYHANRALCHVKLSNFKAAEVDSTVALQLDPTYVKALQRRAFARKALEQYAEAKADYKQVLLLEPKNSLARIEIDQIEDYLLASATLLEFSKANVAKPTFNPRNMFASTEKGAGKKPESDPIVHLQPGSKEDSPATERRPEECDVAKTSPVEKVAVPVKESKRTRERKVWTKLPDGCVSVSPIAKPPHLRSQRPLRRVVVTQVESSRGIEGWLSKENPHPPTHPVDKSTLDVVSRESVAPVVAAESTAPDVVVQVPPVPHTFLQFENSFRTISGQPKVVYKFLKSIPVESMARVFGSWLDCDLLSAMLIYLSQEPSITDTNFLFSFLDGLCRVERFATLILFMSSEDILALQKCFSSLEGSIEAVKVRHLKQAFDIVS